MSALAAMVVCVVTGFAIVCLVLPPGLASDFLVRLSLSTGYGLGVFSCIFFIWLVLGLPRWALIAADVAGLSFLLVRFRRSLHSQQIASGLPNPAQRPRFGWVTQLPAGGFTILLLAWLYGAGRLLAANPDGLGSDAYAIWNLRSRFLFLGGDHWRDGFSPAIAWSHTDYPLLIPASIAHVWKYLGNDSVAVPSAIAFLFTFSTVGLLVSALVGLRGRTQALLGGSALLGSTYFLACGLSQSADVPLSFFFLAGFVLLCLQETVTEQSAGFLALAGLATGFAAWTKNEGLLFFASMVVAQAMAGLRIRSSGYLRKLVPFLAGAAPILLMTAYFKTRVASPGDLYSPPFAILQRFADPTRYRLILSALIRELLLSGHWLFIPAPVLAAAYAFLLRKRAGALQSPAILSCAFTLALMIGGYFTVYLITPHDLEWHLKYSLSRLMVQLWPSVVFLFFMVVRNPEEAYETLSPSAPGPANSVP
jgi:hypothetical protein